MNKKTSQDNKTKPVDKEKQVYSWGDRRPYNSYSNYLKRNLDKEFKSYQLMLALLVPNRDGKNRLWRLHIL